MIKQFFAQILNLKESSFLVALLIGHIIFAGVLGLRSFGFLEKLELTAYDLFLWSQAMREPIDPKIILILANDEDQRQWGWPLKDDYLAELFEIVLACEPNSIGLDLYRDLPVPSADTEGYKHLTELFETHSNIIGIKKFDNNGVSVNAPPALAKEGQIGFNDITTDASGIVRRGLLYMADEEGNVLKFFGLKLALLYLAQEGIKIELVPNNPRAIRLGKNIIAPITADFGGYINQDVGGLQYMLDFQGTPTGFESFNLTQVLRKQVSPAQFKDKIVIIGVNAEATPDFVYTPFALQPTGEQRVAGAIMHAYNISQLIRLGLGETHLLSSWNEFQELLWIWLWTIAGALVCLWARSLWRFSLSLLAGILILILVSFTLFDHYIWVILAAPTFGWMTAFLTVLAYLSNQEKQHRAVLMHLFSKHVSKNVAEAIWKERDQYMNAGRLCPKRITATVLFTDLQGFTTVSEGMEPQVLMDWLNQYMETMVDVVEKQHNGQVNKFIGDAIMAVFGIPIPSTTEEGIADDATRAVDCALSMRRELEELYTVWREQNAPLIRMRVGIFTGPLVAGSLGGIERQEYTVLGDTVNTASRLESFDKNIDENSSCRILIGETTLQYIGKQFLVERVGEVFLKGKFSTVTIYRVIGRNPDLS
jgi:adenylate cyclase